MDCAKEVEKIQAFLQEQLDESSADGFVLGVSGGLDSAVCAHLAEDMGLTLVYMDGPTSTNDDLEHASLTANSVGKDLCHFPIRPAVSELSRCSPIPVEELALGNMQARLRMTALYTIANQSNLLVLGTGNKTELEIGYFTKYGDGGVDLLPLGHLYKTEVRELAEHIGVPDEVIERAPTAGLWEGQTDEGELGVSYDKLDTYLKNDNMTSDIAELIDSAQHKLNMPPMVE